jgi:hypothetical protein
MLRSTSCGCASLVPKHACRSGDVGELQSGAHQQSIVYNFQNHSHAPQGGCTFAHAGTVVQGGTDRPDSEGHSIHYATISHPSSTAEGVSSDVAMTDTLQVTDDSHYGPMPLTGDFHFHEAMDHDIEFSAGALDLLPLYDRFEQEVMGSACVHT